MRQNQSTARRAWTSFMTFSSLGQLAGKTRPEPKIENTFTAVVIR